MDDIPEETFEQLISEGRDQAREQIKVASREDTSRAPKAINVDKYRLYLTIPKSVVFFIVRYNVDPVYAQTQIQYAHLMLPATPLAQLSAVKDCKVSDIVMEAYSELTVGWVTKKVLAGWNSGVSLNSVEKLFILANLRSQVEFVPMLKVSDADESVNEETDDLIGVLNKCRLGSTPVLPGKEINTALYLCYEYRAEEVKVGDNIFKVPTMTGRRVPSNLLAAYDKAKMDYYPFVAGVPLIAAAKKFFPSFPNMLALDRVLDNNVTKILDKIKLTKSDPFRYVAPVDGNRSIFAGKVLTDWNSFFQSFGYDIYGPVVPARVLASLAVYGYVGEVNEVALYKTTPSVFKCSNKLETIHNHTYLDIKDTHTFPESYCYLNPTPEDLNFAIAVGKKPLMLAMNVTNFVSASPQVAIFCKGFARVKINVFFSYPPLVVMQGCIKGDKRGIPAPGITDTLAKLERAIVKGYLDEIPRRAIGHDTQGFRIQGSDPNYKLSGIQQKLSNCCGRYVGLSDNEKKKYYSTTRYSDIVIDDVQLKEEDKVTVSLAYPRIGISIDETSELITINYGACYGTDGVYTGETRKPITEGWKRSTVEDVAPTDEYEYVPEQSYDTDPESGNESEEDDAEMGDVKEPAKDKTPEKPGPASPGYVA